MGFRMVPKSVTSNDLERPNGPYFALFHRMFVYDVVVKQLLGIPRFQNIFLIVYCYGWLFPPCLQRAPSAFHF